jgi:hypothetical protein
MKALLIHVGADQSKTNQMTVGVNAPVFDDGTFEFIPILEFWDDNMYFLRKEGRTIVVQNGEEREGELPTLETRTYCKMDARNKSFGKSLSEYLPEKYESAVVHFDPNFEGCTYGDAVDTSKGIQISKLDEGNYIFFVASLAPYVKEAYNGRNEGLIRYYQKGNMGKYVIGYFEVQAAYFASKMPNDDPTPLSLYDPSNTQQDPVNDEIDKTTMTRIWNNAHTKRDEDYYFIVVGNVSDSALLTRAIKLTENGSPFEPADVGREVFGNVCYPRGVKWVCDPKRIQILLNYCHSHV